VITSVSGMEPYGRCLNVVDVEATCWPGRPPPGQVSEIIEIGLCVVDLESRERVSRHRVLVRPARLPLEPRTGRPGTA
jgi:inhibitor of KinA sporulation pathway (predicted exonuclease)